MYWMVARNFIQRQSLYGRQRHLYPPPPQPPPPPLAQHPHFPLQPYSPQTAAVAAASAWHPLRVLLTGYSTAVFICINTQATTTIAVSTVLAQMKRQRIYTFSMNTKRFLMNRKMILSLTFFQIIIRTQAATALTTIGHCWQCCWLFLQRPATYWYVWPLPGNGGFKMWQIIF